MDWIWKRSLSVKLFASYLAVILTGGVVLAVVAMFAIPVAFEHHMIGMGDMQGMMGGDHMLSDMDIFANFQAGVNEALILAVLAASLAALFTSVLISRQVALPIHALTQASQRIAEGHYEERVQVPSGDPGDLDEVGRLGAAFNQMAARLEQTEAKRRELIGDVSHELRTPLTAIKGSMEALEDGVLTADAETFRQIYQETERLERLVNDLQELSRVEAGVFELDRRLIRVEDLITGGVKRFQAAFEMKGVDLQVEAEDSLPKIYGDSERLGQVLANLLGNALQYTPAGGLVRILANRYAEEVFIKIQDSGIGIPKEHLNEIFTRFYRVDKSRSRASGGSGIGLTICRHLVEAHGGKVWAESEGEDQGSTFVVSLPAA